MGRYFRASLPPAGLFNQDMAALRRNVGKGGFTYRRGGKLSVTGDAEGAGTDSAYFRTSLYRYQKGRLQGSYQANAQLTFSGAFSAASNQNPAPNIDYDYLGMQSRRPCSGIRRAKNVLGFRGRTREPRFVPTSSFWTLRRLSRNGRATRTMPTRFRACSTL